MKKVLFICRGNVGRSQFAEARYNHITKGLNSISAGTHVYNKQGDGLHEHVRKAMQEIGYDVDDKRRKQVTVGMAVSADVVVAMCEQEYLPPFISQSYKTRYWNIPDAKGSDIGYHRYVRDLVFKNVDTLIMKIPNSY
jgi:protein-tyrosine-phosphatase